MIRILRRYQKTIFGVLVIAAAALAMGGFGMGRFLSGRQGPGGAITINGTAIPYEEVHRQRRELEKYYSSRFGPNYEQIMKLLKVNVNQVVVDQIIANTLLDQELLRLGFSAGANELDAFLVTRVFPGGIDQNAFQQMLRDQGLTSQAFVEDMKKTVMRQQLVQMLRDSSEASEAEIRAVLEQEERKYGVSYVVFDPSLFVDKVPVPEESSQQSYYDENSYKYELPERVSYAYTIFNAKDFENSLEVFPEDVEAFYTENTARFELPDEVKVRVVRFNKPARKADGAQTEDPAAAVRDKAQKALARAKDGEDFAKLVTEHSDDAAGKLIGGDMGWVKRGAMGKEFDNEVLALKGPGIAELVEQPDAILLVKVEEYKEKRAKPLEEVRPEIEKEIRTREAPTYASEQAHKYLAEWSKSGKSLKDFAAEKNLSLSTSNGLLAKDKDPDPGVAALTRKLMEMPEEEKQVVELGERSILVQIDQFKETEVPPFAEVKDKVITDLKRKEAAAMAENAARSFVDSLRQGPEKDFEALAKKTAVKVEKKDDLKSESPGDPLFAEDKVHNAIFASTEPGLIADVINAQGKFFVFQVRDIKNPDPAELQKKITGKREQVSDENGEILLQSLINSLKAKADIQVDPSLGMEEEEESA